MIALDITGSVTIEPDSDLQLTGSSSLTDEVIFTILTWSGTRDGSFGNLLLPDSAVLNFATIYNSGSLDIEVTRNSYASLAATKNEYAMGSYLDRAYALGATGDFATVLSSIDTLDLDGVRGAYNQMAAESYDASTSGSFDLGYAFTRTLVDRPLDCLRRKPKTVRYPTTKPICGTSKWEPWVFAYGEVVDRDAEGGFIGYETTLAGVAAGTSKRLSEQFTIALSLGAGLAKVEAEDYAESEVQSVDLGIATAWTPGHARIKSALTYGHTWNDMARSIDFADIHREAEGDFNGDRFGALLELGYVFELFTIDIEPFAGIDYTYLDEGEVREDGAQSINLAVDGRTNDLLAASGGLRLSTELHKYKYVGNDFIEFFDGVWTPDLSARYRSVISETERYLDAELEGAGAGAFQSEARVFENAVEIKAGINFQPAFNNFMFGVHYIGRFGEGISSDGMTADFRYFF